ncbi:hsp90 co-chaperone Cdc37-like [Anneissia japonica]|uniref:hsp90 co-chaperone Cdc37-like n=1 Tax=Anneissia japonica TaxID=1529436 RepID=UPI001425779E|nr:hsp90 co-chaperone Cdc37-like [Anneissia japonica]
MKEMEENKKKLELGKQQNKTRVEDLRKKLENLEASGEDSKQKEKLQADLNKLIKEEKEWRLKEAEIEKQEKATPWNVDTLSKDGFTKTSINKYTRTDADLTEEQKEEKQRNFVKNYEKDIQKFGMFRRWEDSQKILVDNPHLVCEEAANYLAIWCIDLEVEEKSSLMEQVAHQTIVLQFILELAKSMKQDPRACVRPFFAKLSKDDPEYQTGFNDEWRSFIKRVKERAQARLDRAMAETVKEMEAERQARLGPGGLDPVEVFESLPPEVKECFEAKDIPMLQRVLSAMDPKEGEEILKKCIDSGLWIPDAKKHEEEQRKLAEAQSPADEGSENNEEKDEPVYETVKEDGTSV